MKRKIIIKVISCIFILAALLSGLMAFLTLGYMEQEMISIGKGCINLAVYIGLGLFLGRMGFYFDVL